MSSALHRTIGALARASEALAALGIAICVGLNLAQVICRYFLYAPLSWSEEVMRYTMIWVAMAGALAALARMELPAVNLLAELGSARIRRIAAVISSTSVTIFCTTLVVAGWPTLRRAFGTVSPAAEIPLHYAYLAIFIGSGLIAFVAIAMLFIQPLDGGGETDV